MNLPMCRISPPMLPIGVLAILLATPIGLPAQVLMDQPAPVVDQPAPARAPSSAGTATGASGANGVEDIIQRATGAGAATASRSAPPPSARPQRPASAPVSSKSTVAQTLNRLSISPTPTAVAGTDPTQARVAITRLEASYGLPQDVLDLRDRLPSNPEVIVRRLNLRSSRPASPANFSNRTPTVEEVIQALELR